MSTHTRIQQAEWLTRERGRNLFRGFVSEIRPDRWYSDDQHRSNRAQHAGIEYDRVLVRLALLWHFQTRGYDRHCCSARLTHQVAIRVSERTG